MAVNASDSLFLLVKGVPILRFIAAETYGNISYAGSSRVGRGPRTLLLRASILLERCADEEIETYMEGPVLGCVRTATYVAQVAAAAGARGLASLVDAALHAQHPWANPPSTTGAPCCPLDVCGPAVAPVRLQWGGVQVARAPSAAMVIARETASGPQSRRFLAATLGQTLGREDGRALDAEQLDALRVAPGDALVRVIRPLEPSSHTPAPACTSLHFGSFSIALSELPPGFPPARVLLPRADELPRAEGNGALGSVMGREGVLARALWDPASHGGHTRGSQLTRLHPPGTMYAQRYGPFGWGLCVLLGTPLAALAVVAGAAGAAAGAASAAAGAGVAAAAGGAAAEVADESAESDWLLSDAVLAEMQV